MTFCCLIQSESCPAGVPTPPSRGIYVKPFISEMDSHPFTSGGDRLFSGPSECDLIILLDSSLVKPQWHTTRSNIEALTQLNIFTGFFKTSPLGRISLAFFCERFLDGLMLQVFNKYMYCLIDLVYFSSLFFLVPQIIITYTYLLTFLTQIEPCIYNVQLYIKCQFEGRINRKITSFPIYFYLTQFIESQLCIKNSVNH